MPKKLKRFKKAKPKPTNEIKENPTEYVNLALVEKALGNSNFLVKLRDGTTRIGHIQNGLRKSWIHADNFVLIQPMKGDVNGKQEIVKVLTDAEVKDIKKAGSFRIIEEEPELVSQPKPTDIVFIGREDVQDQKTGFEDEIDIDKI